jgi:hypothetical protein
VPNLGCPLRADVLLVCVFPEPNGVQGSRVQIAPSDSRNSLHEKTFYAGERLISPPRFAKCVQPVCGN